MSSAAGRCVVRNITLAAFSLFFCGWKTQPGPGTFAPRQGDEIVVAGKFVHTGTPVVLWMDPEGYDAYRVERRFSPIKESDGASSNQAVQELTSPDRDSLRRDGV